MAGGAVIKAGSPTELATSGDRRLFAGERRLSPRLVSVAVAVAVETQTRTTLARLAAALRIVLLAAVLIAILASIRSPAILVAIRPSAERRPFRTIRTLVARLFAVGPLFKRLRLRLREMRLHLRLRLRRRIGRRRRLKGGRRQTFGERRELVGNSSEIVLVVLNVALRFEGLAPVGVRGLLLRRRDQPEIMLRVLQQILRHDDIAGSLRVARKLQVFLRDVLGGAANLTFGTVRFERARQRIGAFAPVIAPAQPLVLSWSH